MLNLIHLPCSARLLRHSLQRNLQTIKNHNFQSKQYFIKKSLPKCEVRQPVYTLSKCTKICAFFTGASLVHVGINRHVNCEAPRSNRISGVQFRHSETAKFDWQLLWHYLKPHLWSLIAAMIAALAVAILNIEIPQVMGSVVNVVSKFGSLHDSEIFKEEMKGPSIKLVTLYVFQSACTFMYIYLLSSIGESIAYKMKTDLFSSIIKQDIAFFDDHRTGEIINRLTTDVQDFKSSFKQTVSSGLRASTQIIGCSISLLMISPQMTLITLLCIPTVVAIGTALGSLLRKTSQVAHEQVEKTTAVADEAVGNVRTVRAFAMEDSEMELFDVEAEYAMVLNQRLGFGIGLFQAGTNLFLNGMVLGIMYMGGYLLTSNQLTAGELMAYLMATQTIQRSLAQLSMLFGSIIRGISAGTRVFEYIKLEPAMPLKGGATIPDESLNGAINFKNVSFSYPTRPERKILDNFTLHIPAGKTVAIVGSSGNGKTTVAALLERFYDVNGGSILIDGKDIRTLDPSWLRKRALGFISQEPVLFATTVLENIRYGRPDATDAEVHEAARMAFADDFIRNFPKGYNTPVGERGVTLSGGQKQRIAIARALLKNPAILILDEATSALDSESEKIVQAAIEKARKGRTVIVIAHRMSTVANADLIVVLNKGKIAEIGGHQDLLKLKGLYWSLNLQQQDQPPAA